MTLQILPGTRPSSLVFKQSPDIYCIILKQSLEDAKPTNHDYHTQLLNIRIGVCTESVLYSVQGNKSGWGTCYSPDDFHHIIRIYIQVGRVRIRLQYWAEFKIIIGLRQLGRTP